ncbi:hypothetical protein M3Y97_00499100 [Aphelenchoides bicaudatus]|nr:hypothetical protein M3Y97_00499100 [Aphelenchoides bicaudatus]
MENGNIRLPPLFGPKYPKIKAIIYSEFDNEKGPVLRFQIPANTISNQQFGFISSTIMPSEESRDRIIRLNVYNMKIIGYPIAISVLAGNPKYQRGFYIFNLCFVLDKCETEMGEDIIFDAVVQKFSEYLVNLEKEESFLTKRVNELPDIMRRVFEDLNTSSECILTVTKETAFYFHLSHSFHGIEAQQLNQFMVPAFVRQPAPISQVELSKMDVLSQKVCPHVDGVSCIKDISSKIQIDVGLVGRCLRYLHFSGSITFLPLFLYSNQYMPKQEVRALLQHESVRQKCVDYVRFNTSKPAPSHTDVFRLYVSLGPGRTLAEWCDEHQPRENYNIDERRFIQFGVYFDFIRVAKAYAYLEEHVPNVEGSTKASKKSDASIENVFINMHSNDKCEGQKAFDEDMIIIEEERPVYELSVQLSISPFNIIKRLENRPTPGILYR